MLHFNGSVADFQIVLINKPANKEIPTENEKKTKLKTNDILRKSISLMYTYMLH